MCGICGFAPSDPAAPVDRAMLERMADILAHRGPDGRGFHLGPGIGLGVRRLAINDLETGEQPISNEDGSVRLVCNGEIYNAPELRCRLQARGHRFRSQSDVEVIVHLYEEEGTECLQRLRGMFAFALWDGGEQRLMLARDRLGIKSLDYAINADGCYFGSELKAILVTERVERRLDLHGLQDIFNLAFVTAPRTMFGGIRRLPPAHYLLYRRGQASTHRYWSLSFPAANEERSLDAERWAERLREKLEEAVRLHMLSDVPVGAWLSPGIDSSSVAGLMGRMAQRTVPTFSLGFSNPALDELERNRTLDSFPGYGLSGERITCTTADLDMLPKVIWHCEDVFLSGFEISRLLLADSTARRVKVALSGEGADEILGGYPYYKFDKVFRPLAHLPLALRQAMLLGPVLPGRWFYSSRLLVAPGEMGLERYRRLCGPLHRTDWRQLLSADMQAMLRDAGEPEEVVRPPDDFQSWEPMAQLQYYDMQLRLPNHVIQTLDRTSMAESLEVRVPFLDHELVELSAGIPASLKMRGLREKYILRRAMRGVLPDEIVRRRKRGLSAPTADWLSGKLPDFATELLSENSLEQRGYFNPHAVARLERRSRAGDRASASSLFGVLGVQLWDHIFMKGVGADGLPSLK